jgi:enterochelin esterase-like enzyme
MTGAKPGLAIESPRLRAFDRAVARADPRALDARWGALARAGVPLVEPIPGTRRKLLVTFVWRNPPARAVPSIFASVGTILRTELALLPLPSRAAWYRSFRIPAHARVSYGFSPRPTPEPSDPGSSWATYMRSVIPDPLNGRRIDFPRDPNDPDDHELSQSVVELPGAPSARWSRPGPGGEFTEQHRVFRSRFLPKERSVWVELPSGFDPARTRYNLLVAFDGLLYRSTIPTPTIVANLVSAGRIGPTVVVLVGNAPSARVAELAGNPRFVDFLARELWPWLRRRFGLAVPASRVVLAGSSLGGVASAYAAYCRPRIFGNVLAQSGAFPWPVQGPRGVPTPLARLYAHRPRLPIRFYLDAGTLETVVVPGMAVSLLGGVHHLRDVLEAKRYPVTYAEFAGGHDYSCWNVTLADGLIALLGTRP